MVFYVQPYAIHPVKMEASALQRGHATVHQNGQENAAKLLFAVHHARMEGIALLQTPAHAQLAGLGNSVREVHMLLVFG